MSASNMYDLTSSSPDRPLYGSAQRGSYGAIVMEWTLFSWTFLVARVAQVPQFAENRGQTAQKTVVVQILNFPLAAAAQILYPSFVGCCRDGVTGAWCCCPSVGAVALESPTAETTAAKLRLRGSDTILSC
nr:uncharacterized protein LOC109186567 [Ipomoea batatas]